MGRVSPSLHCLICKDGETPFLYHSQFRRLECSFWLFLSFAAFSFPRAHTAYWLCSTRSLLFICAPLFVYPLPNSLFIVGFGCQLPLKHNTPDRKRACNTGNFLQRLAIPMGFTLDWDLQPNYADPIALNCALFKIILDTLYFYTGNLYRALYSYCIAG